MNNIQNYDEWVNEGWGKISLIGSLLFLTTILPYSALSQRKTKFKGKEIEYVASNKLLTKEQIQEAFRQMFKVGFISVATNNFSEDDIDYLPEGKYLIVDAEGFDVRNLNMVLDYTLDANVIYYAPQFGKKKVFKMFKKNVDKLEGVAIVYLLPYDEMGEIKGFNKPRSSSIHFMND